MPQNPVKTGLFVSQIKAALGFSVTPAGGTGVVTIGGSAGQAAQLAYNAVSTAPTTNNLNLTAANIIGGSVKTVLDLTATLAAGATATLPTVATLVAALEAAGVNVQAGGSYELDVMNTSSGNFAWTITTNTGWTLNGTMTVAQNTYRQCVVTFGAGLTTATLQSLGTQPVTSL